MVVNRCIKPAEIVKRKTRTHVVATMSKKFDSTTDRISPPPVFFFFLFLFSTVLTLITSCLFRFSAFSFIYAGILLLILWFATFQQQQMTHDSLNQIIQLLLSVPKTPLLSSNFNLYYYVVSHEKNRQQLCFN